MIDPNEIESYVEDSMHFGMTHEQIKNFVVNSHVTDSRKLRQVMTEISTRNHERKKLLLDIERKKVSIEALEAKLETVEDPFDKKMMEIDLEEWHLDIGRFKIALRQHDNEMEAFMTWVEKKYGTFEELKKAAVYNEEEERKYWIARMGKQAAMDIISYGRIGSGNMTTIMDMPEEDQVETLGVAVQYSGMIGGGIDKLNKMIAPKLQAQLAQDGIVMPKLLEHKYSGQGENQYKLQGDNG